MKSPLARALAAELLDVVRSDPEFRSELASLLASASSEADVLTLSEAAKRARLSTRTLRRFIADGRLEAYGSGRLLRVSREGLDGLLRGGRRRHARRSRIEPTPQQVADQEDGR